MGPRGDQIVQQQVPCGSLYYDGYLLLYRSRSSAARQLLASLNGDAPVTNRGGRRTLAD